MRRARWILVLLSAGALPNLACAASAIQSNALCAWCGLPILGAVAQGQFAGLDQFNIGPLPDALRGCGEVPIGIYVAGQAANTVTVVVR